ncbi:Small-subunit processome [Macleaya cordata]|uniref:Small-subunit processome n=1 Tax=Macleaya cordata TaxID=56857 RepID=A0A200PQL6_MACCD|nr:Small-subunit processome [Macleaya cordata]
MGRKKLEIETVDVSREKKKVKKKRAASDLDLATAESTENTSHVEAIDELHVDDDLNEPTMGEKLASLNLLDDDKSKSPEEEESSPGTKPPSADSVHVLLKQALHADDRVLLLDCLYTQDEKVIANSTSLLNPSDALKLLDCLVSMIQSRGAVLACALPWLRSLLLQHASGIISQESSLLALNSLYQLIESRVSTFRPTLQLSSCLDYLFAGISDEVDDEMSTITPVIYEDKDESDEDESEDAMDSDQENEEQQEEIVNGGFSDFDESDDDMSD